MSNVTYRQISKETGFSIGTVYLAFKNSTRISQATRSVILKCAERLHYAPSPYQRQLMTEIRKKPTERRCLELGFINNWSHSLVQAPDEPLQKMFQRATRRAEELGYRWKEYWTHESSQLLNKMDIEMWQKSVDGILIFPPRHIGFIPHLQKSKVPVFVVGLNLPELNYPCVEADHYFNAELACMKLIAKKCKRIGFVLDSFFHESPFSRFEGAFRATIARSGLAAIEPLLCEGSDVAEIARYIEDHRCDGILTVANCDPASVARAGGKFAKRVKLACYGGWSVEDARRGVPGVDDRNEVIGAIAVEQLALAIESQVWPPSNGPFRIHVPGVWTEPQARS